MLSRTALAPAQPIRHLVSAILSSTDAELDAFVAALASRIASFDKWAIANTKRLVNHSNAEFPRLCMGLVGVRSAVMAH